MMIETKRRGCMFSLAFGCLALAASGAIGKQGKDEGPDLSGHCRLAIN